MEPPKTPYRISQVAVVVKDLDAAMKMYHEAFGWGPWNVYEHVPPKLHDQHLHGQPAAYSMLGAECEVQPGLVFELIQPLDGPKFPGYSIETTATLLAEFDRNAAQALAALARADDAAWDQPWTLKRAGQQAATGTRYLMTRTMVVNHLVHHRAQLGLYLRLVDEQVPSMYGPTADDKG